MLLAGQVIGVWIVISLMLSATSIKFQKPILTDLKLLLLNNCVFVSDHHTDHSSILGHRLAHEDLKSPLNRLNIKEPFLRLARQHSGSLITAGGCLKNESHIPAGTLLDLDSTEVEPLHCQIT